MINASQGFYRRLVPPRNIAIFLVLLALSATKTLINAQQNSKDVKESTSLMLQFFGPEALGIHINHNVMPRVSLNLGIGFDLDAHLGFNAYFSNRELKRLALYGGLQVYLIRKVQFFTGNVFGSTGSSSTNKRDSQVGLYLPIGFEYIAKKGFTIQLDVGPNIVRNNWNQTNTGIVMGSFKIGYTFRPKQ